MDLLKSCINSNKDEDKELLKKIESIQYELDQIRNSKRYKFINKLANIKNKIANK